MLGRGALAVIGVVVLMSGCGSGGGDPAPLTSVPSRAATTSASPTPTSVATTPTATALAPPSLPAEAAAHTPEGAAAFVQYWFDTVRYSQSVMDSAPIRALGECLTCVAFAETIDDIALNNNHLVGGEASIRNIAPNAIGDDGSTSVVALFSATEQIEVAADGSQVSVVDSAYSDIQYLFALSWPGSAWSVVSIRGLA